MSQNKYLKMKNLYDKTHVKPISKKTTARSNSTPYIFLIFFLVYYQKEILVYKHH